MLLVRCFFPKLRRIEIVVEYRMAGKSTHSEIAEMIYTHPDPMSLEEILAPFSITVPNRPVSRSIRNSRFHFPDVIANVNAAGRL